MSTPSPTHWGSIHRFRTLKTQANKSQSPISFAARRPSKAAREVTVCRNPILPNSPVSPIADSQESRQFAVEVVERLRHAGFEALWAGGCVRDQLLGREPKDYDVATNATPQQIRDLFGHRRTIAVGAAFGVITVLGKRSAGPIEVATFRRDAAYSDGRHPDSVTFSTAEEDAQRRDFTINGLFFDPLTEQVIDHVDGQADLAGRVIRAIRDPYERFAEDKLRMLRAVRFAATFGFTIERKTKDAIEQLAGEIVIVSAERIAAEMRRMLVHENRRVAVELLRTTGLLTVVLQEAKIFDEEEAEVGVPIVREKWRSTLTVLECLDQPSFATALAALIRDLRLAEDPEGHAGEFICQRWKLSNEESEAVRFLLEQEDAIRHASHTPWPQLQRLLISSRIAELLCYGAAVCQVLDGNATEIEYCRAKLQLPFDELNPAPLVTGDDLKQSGMNPGPAFKLILEKLRDAQLEKQITTKDEAMELARRLADGHV